MGSGRVCWEVMMSELVAGWKFVWSVAYPPHIVAHWAAESQEDKEVSVRLSDDGTELWVGDDEQYYPSGSYSVPLAVIEELRERFGKNEQG